jgi:DNA-binding XRE family transcriptional regulator
MRMECPACEATDEAAVDTLRKGSLQWGCPGCRRLWDVRTVFFERPGSRVRDLGRTVRRLRSEQQMTQSQLGDLVGVTAAYISHIEAAKRHPAPSLVRRILEALGAHDEAAKV